MSSPTPPIASDLPNLVGQSEAFQRTLTMIERIARYDAPALIRGETGTGKELAARAIHYLSSRRKAPFVALNCGAVPENLVETELFGYERGAFTDARQATSGLVAAADGGTLFLDEIDSLPQRAQVSLLRFLQDKRYRTVGGRQERFSNIRVVAAASPRLHELLDKGAFRDDLAFRINVLLLDMPPLRERGDDAGILAEYFAERHARHYGVAAKRLSEDSRCWLSQYDWPGNVRELDNVVQRALLLSDSEMLELRPFAGIIFTAPRNPESAVPVARDRATHSLPRYHEARASAMSDFDQAYLRRLMDAASGNVTRAAFMAGKERRSLGRLLIDSFITYDTELTRNCSNFQCHLLRNSQ
jgi:two-component system, NtrC family, response regulator GlrR